MRTVAILSIACLWAQSCFAQAPIQLPGPDTGGAFSGFIRPYKQRRVAPISLANSSRMDALVRAGNLYLSLHDAIALAIENNIDVEVRRYDVPIAESDILRAKGGGQLRGIPTTISIGPSSASGGVLAGSGSFTGSGGGLANNSGNGGVFGGVLITSIGTQIPNFDPVLFADGYWQHITQPLSSTVVTGTTSLLSRFRGGDFGIQKGFGTGTTVTYQWNTQNQFQNSPNNTFNPSTTGRFALDVQQNLLQGFGRAVNNRFINVAKKNRRVSELNFEQQLITTVGAVIGLYWDLVALRGVVKIKDEALKLSEGLYRDNKAQVEIGTLASIEVVRADAEVARSRQELTDAETAVLQQETILKNFLTRSDPADLAITDLHIVPTDTPTVPDQESVQPIQDLFAAAFQSRPEMKQNELNLDVSKLNKKGTESALLPSLVFDANFKNHALAGQLNTIQVRDPATGQFVPGTAAGDPFFLGGFGGVLRQLFGRNFPDYSVALSLSVPLRNRTAQADLIRDELTLRQQELNLQKLRKQVRVDVQNALIGLKQAHNSYQSAVKSRALGEQTLEAERKKYQYGTSTLINVIQTQRDLSAAQIVEVNALNNYSRARALFDQALGQTLASNRIAVSEAIKGQVTDPPSALPVDLGPPGPGSAAASANPAAARR